MVIPVTLDAGTQAAVDAARAAADNTLIAVPRLDGEYGGVGAPAAPPRGARPPNADGRLGPPAPRRARRGRADQRGCPGGHGEKPAGVPAAPAARRHPQGAGRG